MEIKDLARRLSKAQEVLARMAEGDLDVSLDIEHFDDPLAPLEIGINSLIADLRETFESNQEKTRQLMDQRRDLQNKLETIEKQGQVIRELSTPVMEIWDDVLVLPIIGEVDTLRAVAIMEALLMRIHETGKGWAIVDVTGLDNVEAHTADYLVKIAQAAALLGTRVVLTGVRPAVAEALTATRADFQDLTTCRTLEAGLKLCLARGETNGEGTKS